MTEQGTQPRPGLLVCVAIVSLIVCTTGHTWAQDGPLTVGIARPGEGETFYAGPNSLIYSVNVTGWAIGTDVDPGSVEVTLEVLKDTELAGKLTTHPEADGTFTFAATVNPDGLPLARPDPTCQHCHYETDFDLSCGGLLLRVTAKASAGRTAVAERHIIVDCSSHVTVPVQVVFNNDSGTQTVSGIPVTSSTWLYEWRARYGSAVTDNAGRADVPVEALAETSTLHVFRVRPTVIDGLLYESVEPVEVTLAPGAPKTPPITLKLHTKTGEVRGRIEGYAEEALSPVEVRAIHLPNGKSYATGTSAEGKFEFLDLPIGEYLIAADHESLARQGYSTFNRRINLFHSPAASPTLPLVTLEGSTLSGKVQEAGGRPLPFAWVAVEELNLVQGVTPESGAYDVFGVPQAPLTVYVTAPGFYSQAEVVTSGSHQPPIVYFRLKRRPETDAIRWGDGEVIIPPETKAGVDDHRITLASGWLWGHGGDAGPIVIRTDNAEITLRRGRFALENQRARHAWLYILDGQAEVRLNGTTQPTNVEANEMLALTDNASPMPVSYNPHVVTALHRTTESPVPLVWEPTVEAQIQNRLSQIGIGLAQVLTFLTYVGALLLLLVPLGFGWRWWAKRYSKEKNLT